MDNINKILADIMDNNLEVEVYRILHTMILKSYEKTVSENKEARASLRAIKKLNDGKNKAINNLCE